MVEERINELQVKSDKLSRIQLLKAKTKRGLDTHC